MAAPCPSARNTSHCSRRLLHASSHYSSLLVRLCSLLQSYWLLIVTGKETEITYSSLEIDSMVLLLTSVLPIYSEFELEPAFRVSVKTFHVVSTNPAQKICSTWGHQGARNTLVKLAKHQNPTSTTLTVAQAPTTLQEPHAHNSQ